MKKHSAPVRIYKKINSYGAVITFCVAIVVFIVCVGFTVSNKISASGYAEYQVTSEQSLISVARKVAPESLNVWQIVYEIKTLNNISGDLICANTVIKIPSEYIDSNIVYSTDGLLCLK